MTNEEVPPIALIVPAALFPDAAAFLRAHGVIIAPSVTSNGIQTAVTLPTGTRRELLRKVTSERYVITLPDGVTIQQVCNSGTGHSVLFIPAQYHDKV